MKCLECGVPLDDEGRCVVCGKKVEETYDG